MMKQVDQAKADLQNQIKEYEAAEKEFKEFEDMDTLRELQVQLWNERKNLSAINQSKKIQLTDLKKRYYQELEKTQAEINRFNVEKM